MSDNGPIITQQALVGRPRADGWVSGNMTVREIPRHEANEIIKANHYSGTVYSGSLEHYGVHIDGALVGVLQWGYAMNPASGGGIVPGLQVHEWRELNRMWMDDCAPRNSESRALSLTVKTLRHNNPRLKMLQSFADERCGGLGVVYQACSFGFYGEHTSTFWELDGRVYHNSAMTRRGTASPKQRALQADADRATRHDLRQFRYLRFLDKRAERACVLARQEYPKHGPAVEEGR